tara:strand:- start:92 stop:1774 length:1683 start_codon:yes stop_codon:yes gene_type:complete
VARRNIFDRDTRAGDYSDTLGSFIENIPSIYGQLAKEKRLEKLDIEDRNFRITQYNNQLLQQARNNKRQKDIDRINEQKFLDTQKNNKFNQAMEVAVEYKKATGDPSKIIQVEKQFFPDTFNQEDANTITNQFASGKDFENNYGYWNSSNMTSKFSSGDDLKSLISESARLSKIGSPQEKLYYRNINKELRNQQIDLASKSGKLITDTSLWNDQAKVDFFNDYGQQIRSKEKQINDIQGKINELIDVPGATSTNVRNKKNRDQYEKTIQRLEKEKALIVVQRQNIQDGFRYPVFESGSVGEFEGMKAVRPNIEEESPSNFLSERYGIEEEEANEALQQVDAELLASVDNMDAKNIDGFLDVLNSNDPKALQNYLSSNQELEGGINTEYKKPVIGTDSTDDPNTLPLPNLTAGSENRFAENIAKEDAMPKLDLGKSEEEISKEALQYDVPSIPEDRQTANYITKDLSKDLSRLNSLKEMQSKIENIEQKSSTITRDYNKRKITISKLENNIKSKIGDFINPVSGDISISDKGYKDAVISRLEKKFGKDLYSILASLSNIQK